MSVGASQPPSTRNISWEPQTTGALRTCSGLYRVYLLHLFIYLHMKMCKQCITVNQTLTYLYTYCLCLKFCSLYLPNILMDSNKIRYYLQLIHLFAISATGDRKVMAVKFSKLRTTLMLRSYTFFSIC